MRNLAALLACTTLLAGAAHLVNVAGVLAPLQSGGALTIGGAGGWKPQSILVSGGLGTASGSAASGFSNVRAFNSIQLGATQDILFGSSAFISAAQATSGATINVNGGVPNAPLANTDLNRLFVVAGGLTLQANGKIVQENTGGPGQFNGLYLTNHASGSPLATVLTLGGDPPSVIDLSGAFINGSGGLTTGSSAALSSPAISLETGLTPGEQYRFNGCPIFFGCSFSQAVDTLIYPQVAQSNLVVENLTLTAEDVSTPDEINPDVTGAGNEEIWRKHRK